MSSRKALLANLLETLVREWGGQEVQAVLTRVLASSGRAPARRSLEERTLPRAAARATAIDLVEMAKIHGEKEQLLRLVAERFDQKEFLPSVADVRQFIIMTGHRPAAMKDRTDAFRILLRYLAVLPRERLEQIAQMASNAGPAQLGPISDAISAAGERLPRRSHE